MRHTGHARLVLLAPLLGALVSASAGCALTFDTSLPASDAAPGDAAGADAAGADAESLPSCDAYCRAFNDACGSDPTNAFLSLRECATFCNDDAQWDPGSFEDRDGNTIGCRIYHANAASEGNAALHCGHAGVTGGDVCGSWCVNYCSLVETICGDSIPPLYDDFEDCLDRCDHFDDDGAIGDTTGDTVQCRLYHLHAATADRLSAAIHCAHASERSTATTCSGDPP
ncbi:MAG: hypothetical protein H6698_01270 [Myxococcales bacterium]|nr:hypothetical protein [Myxococcales bacterium]MCB9532940.1 hypothetical protein [Myxococcales bacterium]